MKTIVHAVGARPNFVKLAPVFDGLAELGGFRQVLVHTGQHYDPRLSDLVLDDLGLPAPDRHLGVGSGTHAEQTGRIMVAFEPVLLEESPDLVVVAGDVNSTVACALTAAKLGIPVAHVESGLRSFDWTMPEELNRVLTDRISTLLFTHSPEAAENLSREGVDPTRIHYVGNTMIDSLVRLVGAARERAAWDALGLEPGAYLLVTLHRPSNVDEPGRLAAIVDALVELGARDKVVFPLHPRTAAALDRAGLLERLATTVRVLEPLRYLDFLSLETAARAVLTDSGGVQEETAALGIRCYTFRANTERPITIEVGTNTLLGEDPSAIRNIRLDDKPLVTPEIPLWDGRAGGRAADVIAAALAG
jgi:UDP-N-acetylglucosamine 2-epimerase (non-hydrolysing)